MAQGSNGKGTTAARLALAISLLPSATSCARVPAPSPAVRNVVLVTIDTLRADRVGVGIAPALDALTAGSIRFTAARAAVPLTLPSHTTIHTGLLPPDHGVHENGSGPLAPSHPTIATLLKGAGYRTAAFVGAFVLDRRFGLAQGFDIYDDQIARDARRMERLEAERPGSEVADRALAWIQQPAVRSSQSAFFLWVHFYDPHAPYTPPPEFRGRGTTPYDGEVAYAATQLGRLIDALRADGLLDRTLIIVAGDHGEGLGDHGERTHGMLLYDSTLRVPLIIRAPGRDPATISQPVTLAEIAPTILRAAGVVPPAEMTGRDLLALPINGGRSVDLYSESDYPRVAGWSPVRALTDGRWKAIVAGSATELYDVQADAAERHDVASSQASVVSAMRARAEQIHGRQDAAAAHHAISADAQERLRALGYVASSVGSTPDASAPNPARDIAAWNSFENALAALESGDPSAVAALKALADAHPEGVVFQSTYARALKDAGRPGAALAVYRRAVGQWSADATLFHDLAVAAREAAVSSGPHAISLREEARRADQAALALEPDNASAHNGLGLLAIDGQRPSDAAREFERAAALDPHNASYWTNLGNAQRAAGDRIAAEQAYRRALDVDARAGDAANGLGVLLVEAERPAEAVRWFERALSIAPDLVEARLNLGIAYEQSGNRPQAAAAYRAVLASDPTHRRERAAAKQLLAALGAAR